MKGSHCSFLGVGKERKFNMKETIERFRA